MKMPTILDICKSIIELFILLITAQVKGYDLFIVTAFNSHERSILYNLHYTNESIIFLNGITNEAIIPMQVLVEKSSAEKFHDTLEAYGIAHSRTTYPRINHTKSNSGRYSTWKDIITWSNKEQKNYPMLNKTTLSYTYERREIFVLSIIKNKINPSVVIVAGEQGRDWMSASLILSLIKYMVEQTGLGSMLDYYNFYFLPIMNPDGYIFSMEKDEFWNKNRKVLFPHKTCYHQGDYIVDNTAIGVNIERNWYHDKSSHAKDDKCSSIYPGHKPLSEEETKTVAMFLNTEAHRLMAFINVIGYGNRLITIPFSESSKHCNNHGVLMELIAATCSQVYEEYNVTYNYGPTSRFFCNSADWVKEVLNVPVVYTVHMQYQDEIVPQLEHVASLSHQLSIIIRETLILSKEIYGPLFNDCKNIQSNTKMVMVLINVLCTFTKYLKMFQ